MVNSEAQMEKVNDDQLVSREFCRVRELICEPLPEPIPNGMQCAECGKRVTFLIGDKCFDHYAQRPATNETRREPMTREEYETFRAEWDWAYNALTI
jgi:hypothetical protein